MTLFNPFFILSGIYDFKPKIGVMKNRIEISEREKNIIIEEHRNGVSLRKLEKKHPYSFTFIQKLVQSNTYSESIKKNYPQKDGYLIIAKCKTTGKEFIDYKNHSGSLTTHIINTHQITVPSNYKRKSLEYKTGKFWYDVYFEFIYREIKQSKKCLYCDWTTEDVDNQSGAYEKHLNTIHNIDKYEHLNKYPEDSDYFNVVNPNIKLIECKICGEKFKSITNTHLKEKHNMTQLEYKIKFGELDYSDSTKLKLKRNYDLYLKNKSFKNVSNIENIVINGLDCNLIQSDRNILDGKEIDILIPNKGIGIEINGNIFHTEIFGKKDRNYHLNKTIECEKNNINLIHIFEDEIMNSYEIVISKLNHILKQNNSEKIHARKCVITDLITTEEKSHFLNMNHIQGNDKSTDNIIAKYNDEIVAIMCFNNKRNMNKSKNHDDAVFELTRFTVKNDIIITGIASRMIKFFIKKYSPQKIISFADRRWTPNAEDNLYTKLGFELTKTLKPEYWYYNPKIDRHKRFHKFGFGKKSIKKKFPEIYDDNKSEWEIMQELGYDRIWDCGKFRYELIL